MTKGQLAALDAMANGSRLALHKLDRKAHLTSGSEAVNLNTFHALREKDLIEIDERGIVITYWRITPAGLRVLRHEQEETRKVV